MHKSKTSNRLLAALLAVLMAVSMLPGPTAAQAATTDHPEAVTVTVKDEDGKPVQGATVTYRIDTADKQGTEQKKTTDAGGVVELIKMADAKDQNMTIAYCKATLKGYTPGEMTPGTAIAKGTEHFDVQMVFNGIKGVTIEGNEGLVYTGQPQELVRVKGLQKKDQVLYALDSTPVPDSPKGTDAKKYSVAVTVKRQGFDDLQKTVEVTIAPAEISLQMKARKLKYNERPQQLVQLDGRFQPGDKVTWKINDEPAYESTDLPARTNAGNYKVVLTVERGSNYKPLELSTDTEIALADLDLGRLQIKANNFTYDGNPRDAVLVENKGDYDLHYRLGDKGNFQANQIPKLQDAGTYTVYVKAVKPNYADAQYPEYPISVTVAKAKRDLRFANSQYVVDGVSSVELAGMPPYKDITYDFKADDGTASGGQVKYSLQLEAGYEDIATIDETTGKLTVLEPGAITVVASFQEENNYLAGQIKHTLVITSKDDPNYKRIVFETKQVNCVLGQNGEVVSENRAKKADSRDRGNVTYSAENAEQYGLQVDSGNGRITVSDFAQLDKALREKNGSLSVTVKADKERYVRWGFIVYPADSDSYTLTIRYFKGENMGYTIAGKPNEQGWYSTAVTVSPKDGEKYTIAKECNLQSFAETAVFDNQGAEMRYVYLRDKATGGISDRIPLQNVKIDTQGPDAEKMRIEYDKLNPVEKLGKLFGFYRDEVTIRFIVEDETDPEESGVQSITWTYTKEADGTSSILPTKSETIQAKREGDQYVAVYTLKSSEAEQFRGHLSFTAKDVAGNGSNAKTDDRVIVLDTVSPKMKATHTPIAPDGICAPSEDKTRYYYNGDVKFQIEVTEANFFPEDAHVQVIENGQTPKPADITWESKDEKHVGTLELKGDGDYFVTMSYRDNSGNPMEPAEHYTSQQIIIDHTPASLDGTEVNQGQQTTTFCVTERNFRAQDVTVTGTIRDITGKPTDFTLDALNAVLRNPDNWKTEGDVHTFTYDYQEGNVYHDGIYDITLSYTDQAGNPAQSRKLDPFVIDHGNPTGITVTYSDSLLNTVLDALTLGFYKPRVKVTFTGFDNVSGIDTFTWKYIRQAGASEVNRPTDTLPHVLKATQSSQDKSKFTAELILPEKEAEQLRGYLTVYATDGVNIDSEQLTDDHRIIVVDNIAPEVDISYNPADRTEGNRAFYKEPLLAEISVKEANFFPEDVVVTARKDGGAPTAITPKWTDEAQGDVHRGTFQLEEDGDYTIHVEYRDRSDNFDKELSAYTSHPITIDTCAPVISVTYQNENVIRTLVDRENHQRKYYGDTQSATISIREHNFDPQMVQLSIVARDVTGKSLDTAALCSKSDWSVDSTGDVHSMTITYPGDANYTFDIECTDAAKNEAQDYTPDYFTVDKTAPVNLSVEYSTSLLDTVLGAVSFGFYDSKVTVTITAEDATSEIDSFLYSYVNAPGVSSVNAGSLDQLIGSGNIHYTREGRRATASFQIPGANLDSNHQFNGTVAFTAEDRSGNVSERYADAKRIVVDTIAPTAQIAFNSAANVVGNVAYYGGNIVATMTVHEANFYPEDVQVMVSKDGGEPSAVTPTWTDSSADIHVGTFTLTETGDYIVTVNYRDKSRNQMATYTSGQMTIDTEIRPASFQINGEAKTEQGGAYKGEAQIAFQFEDRNFDTKTIKLTRTRFDSVEDVTDRFIRVSDRENGGSGSFTIPEEVGNDGIYLLSVSVTDKALHTVQSQLKFTINRYGSVYEYDSYLTSLIRDGGQHVKGSENGKAAITQDFVITEYNADRILEDSLKILITRDGEPVDAQYTTTPEIIDDQVDVGQSGWYQYVYTIKASNFAKDGVYKITLTSAYGADDSEKNPSTSIPDNSVDQHGNRILDTMRFTVDTVAPEIRNVVNLDKPIVNAQTLDVKYTVVDVGGLQSVEVLVNDQVIALVTDFGDSLFDYTDVFTIRESADPQTVRIRVTDLAGNVTDTAAEDFSTHDLYVFQNKVIVSTNSFVRWYANKPLFWGSIGGAAALAAAVVLILVARKKKKEGTK